MVNDHSGFNALGDVTFAATGAGLPFAEISAHDASAGITSVNQNDWDQITAFDTDGQSNNATPDHASDHITITKPGKYLVMWGWSGNGPAAAHDWDFHIAKNNRDVDFNNTSAHLTTPTTQKVTSIGGSAILDLAVDDTVELWVQRTSAGNNIVLTTENCTIKLVQIGF